MNRQEFLASLGVEVRTLEFWIEQQWVIPADVEADVRFSEADLARGRLIQDLTTGFGVNHEGVDIILHLLDQLHGFRRAFEDLHADLESSGRPGALRG